MKSVKMNKVPEMGLEPAVEDAPRSPTCLMLSMLLVGSCCMQPGSAGCRVKTCFVWPVHARPPPAIFMTLNYPVLIPGDPGQPRQLSRLFSARFIVKS